MPAPRAGSNRSNTDLEDEDDFEIVDTAGSEDMDSNDDFMLPSSHSAPDLKLLDTKPSVTMPTNNQWLKGETKGNQNHGVFQNYYASLTKDKTNWLSSKSSAAPCAETCQKKGSMDIENLGSCVSQNMWLRAEDVGQKELSWLCTGSEICSGMSTCVSQPNCLDVYLQKAKASSCRQTSYQSPGFQKYQGKVDQKTWLTNGGKQVESTTPIDASVCQYFHTTTKTLSDWIKPDSSANGKQPTKGCVSFDHIPKHGSAWLKEGTVGKQAVSSTPLNQMPGWQYRGSNQQELWVTSTTHDDKPNATTKAWTYKGSTDNSSWLHESRRGDDTSLNATKYPESQEEVEGDAGDDRDIGSGNIWLHTPVMSGEVRDSSTTENKFEVPKVENSKWLIQ